MLTFHEDEDDYILECIEATKEIDEEINIYEQKKKSKAKSIKINNSILALLFQSLF
jgi:hypothetical protein